MLKAKSKKGGLKKIQVESNLIGIQTQSVKHCAGCSIEMTRKTCQWVLNKEYCDECEAALEGYV